MLGIIGCMDTPRGVHPKCQGLGTKGGRMGASGGFPRGGQARAGGGVEERENATRFIIAVEIVSPQDTDTTEIVSTH